MPAALSHIRICDFTGQLAGAGATRWLASFGAQVIRIEDPTNRGRWDILRGSPLLLYANVHQKVSDLEQQLEQAADEHDRE